MKQFKIIVDRASPYMMQAASWNDAHAAARKKHPAALRIVIKRDIPLRFKLKGK